MTIQSRPSRYGFTMVELLVLIAIIATLMGILLPAVQVARSASRQTQCASNLRQVGLAMGMFCDTHQGRFPYTSHTGGDEKLSWIYTVAPFMESVDAVRICPDDPKRQERLEAKLSSYVLNAYLTSEPATLAVTNYNRLQAASKTVVCFELADQKEAILDSDHVHNHGWFTVLNLARRRVLTQIEGDIATRRHANGTHMLYADWHVDMVPEATIAEWAISQTPAENFCTPK
jgi:prepilin-type processing-associated H-X9-DG protein